MLGNSFARPAQIESGYNRLMAPPEKKPNWVQISNYASLGVMLPASTVTGYFIGVLLDHFFGTHFLYLVFLIAGIVAGFVQMIRIVSKKFK